MKFCSLYSGSSGNSLYVSAKDTAILVDAGLSGKQIERAMNAHQLKPEKLQGILVTHEHRDHIHGVGVLSRRYHLPIYANEDTWQAMENKLGKLKPELIRIIPESQPFPLGDLEVGSFPIQHDAANPVGFTLHDGKKNIAIATDTGLISEDVKTIMSKMDLVVLESNHDLAMLESGCYPYPLKQRIKSSVGHLSNVDAAEIACYLAHQGVAHIILAHLSAENNYPLLAYQTVATALEKKSVLPGKDLNLAVAKRSGPGTLITL